MPSVAPVSYDTLLAEEVAQYYADPLGFVLAMWPWGEDGPLQGEPGPDAWQLEMLQDIGRQVRERQFDGVEPVKPQRHAISSGHGIGKSTMSAWLTIWIMSTRPYCRGTVTANTITQVDTKTWAAILSWLKSCKTAHWFEANTERLYRKGYRDGWFVAPQSSKEENSEAFAGQHAKKSTSFYIFDEASAIPDKIYEVAEGGLSDGEPMIFLFGNPTQTTGGFHRACFGTHRHRWTQRIIDSRACKFTNKAQIEEWITDYGIDSDFVRVRVLGLPPNASDAQFIDQQRVSEAQKRQVAVLPDEPLVAGCDLAWGGSDFNVVRFRRGRDARSIPPIRVAGEHTRDAAVMVNRLADILSQTYGGQKVSMLFLDSAGIAGAVGTRLREMGHKNVLEVNFGSDSPNQKRRYMRDHMWAELRDWLLTGAIDASPRLESDLVGPGLRPDRQQRIWLESKEDMKKRGIDSPDEGDALALTFAHAVKVAQPVIFPPLPGRGAAPTTSGGMSGWA